MQFSDKPTGEPTEYTLSNQSVVYTLFWYIFAYTYNNLIDVKIIENHLIVSFIIRIWRLSNDIGRAYRHFACFSHTYTFHTGDVMAVASLLHSVCG